MRVKIKCRDFFSQHEDHQSEKWQARNQVKGERWLPTQPIVMPLLPPNGGKWSHVWISSNTVIGLTCKCLQTPNSPAPGRSYSLGPPTKSVPMDFHKHVNIKPKILVSKKAKMFSAQPFAFGGIGKLFFFCRCRIFTWITPHVHFTQWATFF